MSEPVPARNYSLLRQFLVPILICVLATGFLVASVSKWASDRASLQSSRDRLLSTGRLLSAAPFPLTPSVLTQLHELTSLDFVLLPTSRSGLRSEQIASTFDLSDSDVFLLGKNSGLAGSELQTIQLAGESMRSLAFQNGENILLILERASIRGDRWQSFLLPLVTGLLSSIAIGVVAAWIAAKFASRIDHLKTEVNAIAKGDFSQRPLVGPADDIRSLQMAIQEMSAQLDASQKQIAHNERARLIHLLASGLAHELRNHLTGAKLALQTCNVVPGDAEAIAIAVRQLDLAEGQIRRLLAVRSDQPTSLTSSQSVKSITQSVVELVKPIAIHRQIQLDVFSSPLGDPNTDAIFEKTILSDADAIVGVLVNLAMNAIEAVESNGKVEIAYSVCASSDLSVEPESDLPKMLMWTVRDNGPGPREDIQDSMFDPFVTTKTEGVGLGLSMCKRVAATLGGHLRWKRTKGEGSTDGSRGWTVFEFSIKLTESKS